MRNKQDKPKSAWSYWPPADQLLNLWGVLVWIPIAIVFFLNTWISSMSAAQWLGFYNAALAVAVFGSALIFYAKLPLYREHRFFTFGSRAILESRRSFYCWGYRCVACAAALLLCLLLPTL